MKLIFLTIILLHACTISYCFHRLPMKISSSIIRRRNNFGNIIITEANNNDVLKVSCKKEYSEIEFEIEDSSIDKDLERKMAQELFNSLRGNKEFLYISDFLAWEDIKDVLSRGFVDQETINYVLVEAGVTTGCLTFEQFVDVVELINQVSVALEETGGLDIDGDDDDYDDSQESIDNSV